MSGLSCTKFTQPANKYILKPWCTAKSPYLAQQTWQQGGWGWRRRRALLQVPLPTCCLHPTLIPLVPLVASMFRHSLDENTHCLAPHQLTLRYGWTLYGSEAHGREQMAPETLCSEAGLANRWTLLEWAPGLLSNSFSWAGLLQALGGWISPHPINS